MNSRCLARWFAVVGLCALLLPASPLFGEVVSYVNEAAPIFGNATQLGDTLLFAPDDFSSRSSGRNGVDMTDGLMRLWITSPGNIDQLEVNEGGAYFFFGRRATDLTQAYVGANAAQLFITSVNGEAVNGPLVSLSGTMEFTPSSPEVGSRTFFATEPVAASGWQGRMVFEHISSALANTRYAGGTVTGVMLVFDDVLATSSQAGTIAYIDKKWIAVTTDPVAVPEPCALTLLGTSAVGLAYALRRRKSAV